MKTLQEVIENAARQLHEADVFCGHGTDNVRDEAAWLACHALGLSPVDPVPNDPLTPEQEQCVDDWVKKRITTRRPTAYLTGTAWFAGMAFQVSEDVLVPRSPLAEMISEAFSPWLEPATIHHALDLCTGSGCIGIATAAALPHAQVDLADISPAALAIAKRNIQQHQLSERVQTHESDFFEGLPAKRYDLILTNPPYVPQQEADTLPDEYMAEPGLGLASGDDGLDAACIILNRAADFLTTDGHLVLEVGGSWERLQAALPEIPFMWLDFYHGGDGVLIIRRDELIAARGVLQAWQKERNGE